LRSKKNSGYWLEGFFNLSKEIADYGMVHRRANLLYWVITPFAPSCANDQKFPAGEDRIWLTSGSEMRYCIAGTRFWRFCQQVFGSVVRTARKRADNDDRHPWKHEWNNAIGDGSL